MSFIDRYLEEGNVSFASGRAGVYRSHRACVELGARFYPFDDSGNGTNLEPSRALAVYVHEYMHYLQNFGTTSGLTQFLWWTYVLGAYSRALDKTGVVRSQLAESDAGLVREAVTNLRILQGEAGPNVGDNPVFLSASVSEINVTVNGVQRPVPQTVLRFRSGESDHEVIAGTVLIEEGIAYELECMIERAAGLAPASAKFFPYKALRAVAGDRGVAHPIVYVALATLALNTRSPWPNLLAMLDRFHRLDVKPEGYNSFLENEAAIYARERELLIGIFRDEELPGLEEMFAGRGAVESGMRYVVADVGRILDRRLQDPYFELAPFVSNAVDLDALRSLLLAFPSCDVVCIGEGPRDVIGQDELFSFHGDALDDRGLTYSEGTRALEAQLSNMMVHLRGDSIVLTSTVEEQGRASAAASKPSCPFVAACDLDRRCQYEDWCVHSPWKQLEQGHDRSCWYVSGLLGSIGLVNVVDVIRQR